MEKVLFVNIVVDCRLKANKVDGLHTSFLLLNHSTEIESQVLIS